MAPIKPCCDPSITHRTKESLDAKNITYPAPDVLHRAEVKGVVADLINQMTSLLCRQTVSYGGFMLFSEMDDGHWCWNAGAKYSKKMPRSPFQSRELSTSSAGLSHSKWRWSSQPILDPGKIEEAWGAGDFRCSWHAFQGAISRDFPTRGGRLPYFAEATKGRLDPGLSLSSLQDIDLWVSGTTYSAMKVTSSLSTFR